MEPNNHYGQISHSKNLATLFSVFAILSGLLALCFALYGLYLATFYTESARVAGAEAYMFNFFALRGIAWICAGIVFAVLCVVFTISAQKFPNR